MSTSVAFKIQKLMLRRKLRRVLLATVVVFTFAEILALSPSSVEETSPNAGIDPETLIPEEPTLATGIPKGDVPKFTVQGFNYVSTQGTEKQWKIIAEKAFLYNSEKIVHARTVTAFLYDPEGKITVVTGKEAKYFMNKRDLEVFGAVKTAFPDGFKLSSEYLRYRPNDRKIEIPSQYFVSGGGQEKPGHIMAFESNGLDFAMAKSEIILPKSVKLTFQKYDGKALSKDRTQIESDHCVIDRAKQVAHFTMSPKDPIEKRFVEIRQPTLFAKGRRADLNYGDYDQVLQYLTAYDDVLIRELGNKGSLKYATGGRADFDTKKDVIVLTEFPQVYQDNDTVTGDKIIVHRDTDIVEVLHSNSFSQGASEP